MNIAFLIRSLHRGGAERQLTVLAKELMKKGHQVTVYVFYAGGVFETDLTENGIELIHLQKKGTWDFSFLVRLFKSLKKLRPDVLHGYLSTSNSICALMKYFLPETKIVWGIRSSHMDMKQYNWISSVDYYMEAKLSLLADLVIANSHAGKKTCLSKGFRASKINVVSNGIDTDLFYPDQIDKLNVREKYGINNPAKIIVGFVGRLDPMKDHYSFFSAIKILITKGYQLQVMCIGDGPQEYKEKLQTYVESLEINKYVIWTGAQSQMKQYYNAFDILVSASYGEGFSNVIGEAMSCGVPCVVTDVGDSALIVGDAGIVVTPRDVPALVDGIIKIQQDLNKYSDLARKRIVENFSIKELVQNTEKALEGIR